MQLPHLLAHYGGLPEMAIILVPAIMGLGLWFFLRGGDPQAPTKPPEDTST